MLSMPWPDSARHRPSQPVCDGLTTDPPSAPTTPCAASWCSFRGAFDVLEGDAGQSDLVIQVTHSFRDGTVAFRKGSRYRFRNGSVPYRKVGGSHDTGSDSSAAVVDARRAKPQPVLGQSGQHDSQRGAADAAARPAALLQPAGVDR